MSGFRLAIALDHGLMRGWPMLTARNIRNLFSITPNPADNYLTIQAKTADVWQFVAELQTITGQQIITQHNAQMGQIIWPLANLPAGLYMVILKTPNAYGTEKILITH